MAHGKWLHAPSFFSCWSESSEVRLPCRLQQDPPSRGNSQAVAQGVLSFPGDEKLEWKGARVLQRHGPPTGESPHAAFLFINSRISKRAWNSKEHPKMVPLAGFW